MADLGNHDEDLGLLRDRPQGIVHFAEGRGEGVEFPREVVRRLRGAKVYPHEESLRVAVTELLQVQDVQAVLGKDARHRVDDARFVRTGQREDVVVGHFGQDG